MQQQQVLSPAPRRVVTLDERTEGWMLSWSGQERVRFSRQAGDDALMWECVAYLRGQGVRVEVGR